MLVVSKQKEDPEEERGECCSLSVAALAARHRCRSLTAGFRD
jgi:hypothetical protein